MFELHLALVANSTTWALAWRSSVTSLTSFGTAMNFPFKDRNIFYLIPKNWCDNYSSVTITQYLKMMIVGPI